MTKGMPELITPSSIEAPSRPLNAQRTRSASRITANPTAPSATRRNAVGSGPSAGTMIRMNRKLAPQMAESDSKRAMSDERMFGKTAHAAVARNGNGCIVPYRRAPCWSYSDMEMRAACAPRAGYDDATPPGRGDRAPPHRLITSSLTPGSPDRCPGGIGRYDDGVSFKPFRVGSDAPAAPDIPDASDASRARR